MSDSLLHQVAAGQPLAFEQCLDRFGGLVWSLARRFCPSTTEAEDAVQEIFLDLWRSADRFDSAVSSEVTFVAMIARRRLIDRQRRLGRQPRSEPLPEAIVSPGPTSADRVELSDEAAQAAKALGSLRPEQQQVLKLAIYDGLTHEEIARDTGLPLGTVKTHVRRGLLKVREMLGGPRGDRAKGGAS